MKDPPTVPQDELLQIIGELEAICADLQDVNAEVSARTSEKLQRLRTHLECAPSSQLRQLGWDIAWQALRELAAEVVRRVIETSIPTRPGSRIRERTYSQHDDRRVHQDTARVGRAQAA